MRDWMMMGWMAASLSSEVHPAAEALHCTCNTQVSNAAFYQ